MQGRGTAQWRLIVCTLASGVLPLSVGCGSSDGAITTTIDASTDTSSDAPVKTEGGSDATGPVPDAGPGKLTVLTKTGAFKSIFDAVPDSDGKNIYFTGMDEKGLVGVYLVAATGGTATAVATGSPFVAPFGIAISTDDTTLYVADPGADGGNDLGEILSLPVKGGTPKPVSGTADLLPRGIAIDSSSGKDTLVFSGIDKKTGVQGVFEIAVGGGTPDTLAEGAPFVDPSGVAVDSQGNVYVTDTLAAKSHQGEILKIDKGAAASFATDLWVGYPAGIAFTLDNKGLIVSGLATSEGPDTISSFLVPSAKQGTFVSDGLKDLSNAAGLHRAAKVNIFAFVDSAGDGTDAVYVIN
jgi:sugar lactone lactonase YvrE